MKNMDYKYGVILWGILLLNSCVKNDLYNTPHPTKGAIEVSTNWKECSAEAIFPTNYIVNMDGVEQTVNGESYVFKNLFDPKEYNLLVYNKPEGMTLNGTIATINAHPDGTLESVPGYLFSARKMVAIVADDTLKVSMIMKQHTRSLILSLTPSEEDAEHIVPAESTLTGIVGSIDLANDSFGEDPSGKTINPKFELKEQTPIRATAGKKILIANVRLLGVVKGKQQKLNLTIKLDNGTSQTIETDLTVLLKDFENSSLPLQLDAILSFPAEGDVGGTINGWTEVDNGNHTITNL